MAFPQGLEGEIGQVDPAAGAFELLTAQSLQSGSFTPEVTAGGTNMASQGASFSHRTASWWKLGPIVFLQVDIRFTAKGSATGLIAFGLPAALTPNAYTGVGVLSRCTNMAGLSSLVGAWVGTDGYVTLVDGASTGAVPINNTDLTNSAALRGTLFFVSAA